MTRSLVVAAVALCAIVGAVPAAAAKRPSCYHYGGTTVVQSPKVRIFLEYDEYDVARYYGCLRRVGKRMYLDQSEESQYYSAGPVLSASTAASWRAPRTLWIFGSLRVGRSA